MYRFRRMRRYATLCNTDTVGVPDVHRGRRAEDRDESLVPGRLRTDEPPRSRAFAEGMPHSRRHCAAMNGRIWTSAAWASGRQVGRAVNALRPRRIGGILYALSGYRAVQDLSCVARSRDVLSLFSLLRVMRGGRRACWIPMRRPRYVA